MLMRLAPTLALALPALLSWNRPSLASEGIVSDDEEEPVATEEAPPTNSLPVPFDKKWIRPFFASGPEKLAVARFRSGDFAGAAKDLGRVLDGLPKTSPERNPLRFLRALALASQQSWQAAGEIFEDLWSTYPLLASYHAYHAARCRLRGGDTDGAFTWLARIPSGSVIEPDAVMVKVDAFVAAKRWDDVETEVSTYLVRFPKGPRWPEAMFLRAEALKELGHKPEETTASVQGFGNVSQYAIELYEQMGGKVICVSCWDQTDNTSYSFRKINGIDLKELLSITDRFGGINKDKAKEKGYEILDGDAWIEQKADILLPCAIENQITAENAEKIDNKVKLIGEGANGPTTPEADKIIEERKIFLIPDFLANAGGVTCSYFEQVQSNMNYYWEKDEVLGKLDVKMTAAFQAVSELAKKRKLYMRDAAYVIAISRVAQACKDRGWV